MDCEQKEWEIMLVAVHLFLTSAPQASSVQLSSVRWHWSCLKADNTYAHL